MLRTLAFAGALALACVSPARSAVVLYDSPGGVIAEFVEKYRALAASGQDVRIEGHCASACTTIIGIVPRDRICVGPSASLEFHSGAWGKGTPGHPAPYSAKGTAELRQFYASDVRRILARHGWDARSPHPELIPIYGKELRTIIKPCA